MSAVVIAAIEHIRADLLEAITAIEHGEFAIAVEKFALVSVRLGATAEMLRGEKGPRL